MKRIEGRANGIFSCYLFIPKVLISARDIFFIERLKEGLGKDEISFQKAIYDKILIQTKNSTFRFNLGAARESVISPLFDI